MESSEVVMNPVRQRIIQFLMVNERGTVKEIKEVLDDIPTPSLYRHVKILAENEIIVVAEENRVRGTVENIYELNPMGIAVEDEDGMYQYTELVLQKLKRDGEKFLLPSKPGLIGFVMDETVIDQRVIDEIVNMLCNSQKRYMRVAFIGTNREIKKSLKKALKTSEFMFHFFDDLEAAKEWLVS